MIYKFRAECLEDVTKFICEISGHEIDHFKISFIGLHPDVEVEIEIQDFDKEDYIEFMRNIEDSHVMIQTIMAIGEYTGKRNFDIP